MIDNTLIKTNFSAKASDIVKVLGGFLLLTLSSYVRIPFYPVPITLGTLAVGVNVLVFGGTLSAAGCWIVSNLLMSYVVLDKLAYAHTAGYVLGFMVIGLLLQSKRTGLTLPVRYAIGLVFTLVLGATWLKIVYGLNFWSGILPYVPGECMKLLVFYMAYKQYGCCDDGR